MVSLHSYGVSSRLLPFCKLSNLLFRQNASIRKIMQKERWILLYLDAIYSSSWPFLQENLSFKMYQDLRTKMVEYGLFRLLLGWKPIYILFINSWECRFPFLQNSKSKKLLLEWLQFCSLTILLLCPAEGSRPWHPLLPAIENIRVAPDIRP